MTVSVFSAAKRLTAKSERPLTNLHLQKMTYLTHMFYMAKVEERLVHGHFEAWEFGPVHPKLYHALKSFGSQAIELSAFRRYSTAPDNTTEAKYLDAAVEQLPHNGLVAITHWSGGAWYKNYRPGEKGIEIPDEDIVEEYWKRKNGAKQRSS